MKIRTLNGCQFVESPNGLYLYGRATNGDRIVLEQYYGGTWTAVVRSRDGASGTYVSNSYLSATDCVQALRSKLIYPVEDLNMTECDRCDKPVIGDELVLMLNEQRVCPECRILHMRDIEGTKSRVSQGLSVALSDAQEGITSEQNDIADDIAVCLAANAGHSGDDTDSDFLNGLELLALMWPKEMGRLYSELNGI